MYKIYILNEADAITHNGLYVYVCSTDDALYAYEIIHAMNEYMYPNKYICMFNGFVLSSTDLLKHVPDCR